MTPRLFGLDFTSAPGRRKPITCAECRLTGNTLTLIQLHHFTDFAQFEAFLRTPGPWLAGFDFPFGQPRRLIEALGWPQSWPDAVRHIAALGKTGFEAEIKRYRDSQPPGRKHPRRATDIPANAVSPLMLAGVPVGKMFFQGAPRLLAAGLSILPCHPTPDSRIAFEAYPALVARKFIGPRSYKSDERRKQTPDRAAARRDLLTALRSPALAQQYGLTLRLNNAQADALATDPSGDSLDALLCAIQTAWAASHPNHGLPSHADPLEGWIIDPALLYCPRA